MYETANLSHKTELFTFKKFEIKKFQYVSLKTSLKTNNQPKH